MELSPASHTAWETEDELSTPGLMRPLDMTMKRPSSSSRTPSRGSRRSSHRRSVTPPSRPSPPPMPGSDKTDKSDRATPRVDLATDENISILDPRRFTPTLHASLVGEILALKRDREDKLKAIEGLEAALQATRDEEDGIQATLVSTAKENRSLKRQLALLEGGTSSALGELARERDEAVDSAAETKKRLEGAQRRIKAHEESAERTQELWEKDKDAWEEERRKTDRKVHVLETRLKAILEEVAAFQAAAMEGQQAGLVDGEDGEERNGPDSDAGSIRSVVRDSLRFSLLNNNNNTKTNGFSLADELDGDYDSDAQTDANGRDSVMSNYRHMRNDSRASTLSRTQVHRRHHSGESLIRPGSVTRGRFQTQKQQLEGILAYGIIQEDEEPKSPLPPAQKVDYTDSAVQYSPPPSPKLAPVANNDNNSNKATPFEHRGVTALAAKWEKHHEEIGSTEANQRRKRTSIAKPMPPPIQAPPPAVAVTQKLMVSAGAQTVDIPLSPPKTPRSPDVEQPPTPRAIMVTAGTQTDTAPEPPAPAVSESEAANATLAIPSIAIHPPSSRPTTPKVHRLPQFLKDFGCQVSLSEVPMKSTGIQTEEIRIDQRLDKLPRHLHPSAITSRPTSPAVESQDQPANAEGQFTPVPARNPRRLTSTRSLNGDIPASPRASVEVEPSEERRLPSRRHRIGSMFSSGVHDGSSADELDDFADGGLSDSEFRTALSAPRAVKSPERSRSSQASAPTSPEDAMPVVRKASGSTQTPSSFKLAQSEEGSAVSKRTSLSSKTAGLRPSAMSSTVVGSSSSVSSNSKSSNMRKAAMIQNGIATHQEDTADPPFPIPTRASSRQPLFSGDEQRNRSPQRTEPWHRKGGRGTVYRTNSVRKSRSAAAVPYRNGKSNRRKGSRSPPYSPYGDGPATPTVPPLPHNAKELTTPKKNERLSVSGARRGHRHQNSGATATTDATTGFQSTHSSSGQTQANGVVDAIAQTMVGEWMFKYVRRRKSFGMGADHGAHSKDDSSNDRHRRWVWLAPYERAILWSSKQPSSGSALLGKSGRKREYLLYLSLETDRLTLFHIHSHHSICPRRQGRQPGSQGGSDCLQPLHPHPHTATRPQVHCHQRRQALPLVDSPLFPRSLPPGRSRHPDVHAATATTTTTIATTRPSTGHGPPSSPAQQILTHSSPTNPRLDSSRQEPQPRDGPTTQPGRDSKRSSPNWWHWWRHVIAATAAAPPPPPPPQRRR